MCVTRLLILCVVLVCATLSHGRAAPVDDVKDVSSLGTQPPVEYSRNGVFKSLARILSSYRSVKKKKSSKNGVINVDAHLASPRQLRFAQEDQFHYGFPIPTDVPVEDLHLSAFHNFGERIRNSSTTTYMKGIDLPVHETTTLSLPLFSPGISQFVFSEESNVVEDDEEFLTDFDSQESRLVAVTFPTRIHSDGDDSTFELKAFRRRRTTEIPSSSTLSSTLRGPRREIVERRPVAPVSSRTRKRIVTTRRRLLPTPKPSETLRSTSTRTLVSTVTSTAKPSETTKSTGTSRVRVTTLASKLPTGRKIITSRRKIERTSTPKQPDTKRIIAATPISTSRTTVSTTSSTSTTTQEPSTLSNPLEDTTTSPRRPVLFLRRKIVRPPEETTEAPVSNTTSRIIKIHKSRITDALPTVEPKKTESISESDATALQKDSPVQEDTEVLETSSSAPQPASAVPDERNVEKDSSDHQVEESVESLYNRTNFKNNQQSLVSSDGKRTVLYRSPKAQKHNFSTTTTTRSPQILSTSVVTSVSVQSSIPESRNKSGIFAQSLFDSLSENEKNEEPEEFPEIQNVSRTSNGRVESEEQSESDKDDSDDNSSPSSLRPPAPYRPTIRSRTTSQPTTTVQPSTTSQATTAQPTLTQKPLIRTTPKLFLHTTSPTTTSLTSTTTTTQQPTTTTSTTTTTTPTTTTQRSTTVTAPVPPSSTSSTSSTTIDEDNFVPISVISVNSTATEDDRDVDDVSAPTTVYVAGVVGVLPIAGMFAYVMRRFYKNRRSSNPSDTSSEIGIGSCDSSGSTSGGKATTCCTNKDDSGPHPVRKSSTLWEFPRSKLRLHSLLGEGNFGQVWKGEAEDICGCEGSILVAVKTLKNGYGAKEKSDFMKELDIMKCLGPHSNVVTLLGCCTDQEPPLLILEYVMFGKLLQFLRDQRTRQNYYNVSPDEDALTSKDLTMFAYHAARGMEYIASKGVIHRDLAARNVLIDHNKVCKIADFGLSRCVRHTGEDFYEQKSRGALPIRWMSPESLTYSIFTHKSDVWSLGILVWEIVTLGSTPYPGLSAREVMRRVREGYRLERPEHCRTELYRVISKCWHQDAARRPSFTEIKQELGRLLESQTGYVDLENFPENAYFSMTQPTEEEKI